MKIQKLDSSIYHIIKNIRIAVLVMGTAILFFACENNEIDKIQPFISPENLPTLEIKNFESLITDSGVIRNSIKAPLLLQFENNSKSFLEFPNGMKFIQYNEKKEIISSISADYAKQFVKEEKWEAKNNVVVTNEKGDSLKTEHLIWEEKTEKIYTEEFVKIISPDKVITGIGLTSNQNMSDWNIKNVKGIIYVNVDQKKKNPDIEHSPAVTSEPNKVEKRPSQAIKFK